MKKLISVVFLFTSVIMSAATYYVAPNGNNNNPGTITQPWATWQKGFSSLSAGDILYIRGGTYTGMYGPGHGVYISGRDGTSTNKITVSAYPGEVPVLDCSSLSASAGVNYGILMSGCDNWHIKGLTVKNVREYRNLHKSSGGSPTAGWELSNCNKITLELCVVTGCGNGFSLNGTLHDIYYLNCDAHHNYDYYDDGGLANGFNGNMRGNSTIYYKGCRAWSNSDDGYDNFGGAGYMVYNDCWAYRNGYDTPTIGNGDGFKLGYDRSGTELSGSQRTLYNCISADNRLMGFDESMDGITSMDMELYNCIAYRNANDFGFRFSTTQGTGRTTLRNNIALANSINYRGRTRNISDHNTWDAGAPSVSSADFASLETAQLIRPRKSDGTLPDITFSTLNSTSDLIDKGVNIGLPYNGSAPDMGVFETGVVKSGTGGPTLTYESSTIRNTNPSELEITYNLTLASVVPSVSCFEIKVNSVVRSINNIVLSGKNVYLTLSSPVNAGEEVTLSYTKPASNPLQCTGGTIAETISGKSVANSVVAAAPEYVSSSVEDQTPDKVEMNYDTNLANIVPPSSAFVTKVNGEAIPVIGVVVSESKVILTLEINLDSKDTVTISYNQPSTNPLQTIYGGKAASLSEQQVQNNILGVSTGTEEINDGKTLIFPNPAKEYVKIANLDPGDEKPLLRFFDTSGKLCQEIKLEDLSNMKKVPVRLKPGLYIAQIRIGSKIHHAQKIIVVH